MTAKPTYEGCLVDAELKARAAYSEPGRHYHDQRHLDECLRELDWVINIDEGERRLLRWAILWHDAVYEPGRRDNELRSAELALSDLSACGIPDADAAEVVRLIRLTEHHAVEPGDRLGGLMVSIDLSILGSDPDRYREYAAGVRSEFSHVPDPLFRTGRALVLKRLLKADPLFPDPEFRARLEAQARQNMKEEVRSLGEG
jgi:predicted metal-dependent HD superfamily phosphohydrolase